MKSLIIFIFAIGGLFASEIPSDYMQGVLPNGMTYYIKENHHPKGRAFLRLVVKVGSVDEEEGEQGIAHFVEHLVFRGSENFEDHEVISYVESIGAEFGPDANAYTGVEETVYMLDIPSNNEVALEKSLLILSDFGGRARLSDEAIEAERGVVLDELRLGGSAERKAFSQEWNWKFQGTPYADRLPGGHPEVVKTASSELIRNFYKKHYRPEVMAVIAVGDFDTAVIEKMIQRAFSSLVPSESIKGERPSVESLSIPVEPFYFTHAELGANILSLKQFKNKESLKNEQTLTENLIDTIIALSFNRRLERCAAEEGTPFMAAFYHEQPLVEQFYEISLTAIPYSGQEREALTQILQKYKQLINYGLSQDELDTSIAILKARDEKSLQNIDHVESRFYINALQELFLHEVGFNSYESYLTLHYELLDQIHLDDVNAELADRGVGPSLGLSVIGTKDVEFSWEKIQKEFLTVQVERGDYRSKQLSFNLPDAGKILSESIEGDLYQFELSNGMKVVVKPTAIKKDEVIFYLLAEGGYADHNPLLWNEAKLTDFFLLSGEICGLDSVSLDQLYRQQGMSLLIDFSPNFRQIYGNYTPSRSQELFFTLLHGIFCARNPLDKFEIALRQLSQYFEFQGRAPGVLFDRFVFEKMTSFHPLFSEPNVEQIDRKKIEENLDLLLKNPSDYTLLLVGDLDLEQVKGYLATHVASISGLQGNNYCWPPVEFEDSSICELFIKGKEEIGVTNIMAFIPPVSLENGFQFAALKKLMQQRVQKLLRNTLGNTYSVVVDYQKLSYPNFYPGLLAISYSHCPSAEKSAIDLVLKELFELDQNPVTEQELADIKEIIKQDIKETNQYNWGVMHQLIDDILFGGSEDPLEELNSLTCSQINSLIEEFSDQIKWNTFTWINERQSESCN